MSLLQGWNVHSTLHRHNRFRDTIFRTAHSLVLLSPAPEERSGTEDEESKTADDTADDRAGVRFPGGGICGVGADGDDVGGWCVRVPGDCWGEAECVPGIVHQEIVLREEETSQERDLHAKVCGANVDGD